MWTAPLGPVLLEGAPRDEHRSHISDRTSTFRNIIAKQCIADRDRFGWIGDIGDADKVRYSSNLLGTISDEAAGVDGDPHRSAAGGVVAQGYRTTLTTREIALKIASAAR